MGFLGLFGKKKKEEGITLAKRKNTAMQDAAVAATFAEAGEHDTARSMLDDTAGRDTILVLGREDRFSETLVAYAVDMAKRLDYKLLAVNITDAPLSLAADKRDQATALFEKNCIDNSASLVEKAAAENIQLSHHMEVGRQDEIVEKLHARYPGMRYVLTEPDPDAVKRAQDKVSVPVFDLGSYQGAAA